MEQTSPQIPPAESQIIYWPHRYRRPRRFFFLCSAVALGVFVLLFYHVLSTTPALYNSSAPRNVWSRVLSVLGYSTSATSAEAEERDRLNILLMGMGGEGHEGGTLTDTMVFASVQLSTGRMAMISIPRDTSVNIPNYGWRKINAVHALAEKDNKGSGPAAAVATVSEIMDQPIDYYVTVDFDGFEQMIDELGGVTIEVDHVLDDYQYPIRGREEAEPYESRFEHLHFDAGRQKMNGELALKYARSRHAVGPEAGDFARARRQQKVITAVMQKVVSLSTLANPIKINALLQAYNRNVKTNITAAEALSLYKLAKRINRDDIIRQVLDDGPNGYLTARVVNSAYLLFPRTGDWGAVQQLAANIFVPPAPSPATEKPQIEILNGTFTAGLAAQKASSLEQQGFVIAYTGNADTRPVTSTMIINMTGTNKPLSLAALQAQWPQATVINTLPGSQKTHAAQADFVVIMGQDLQP